MTSSRRDLARRATARVRPSEVSRDRLAVGVHGDIAELRVRLEEAILRSEAYLEAGFPRQASAVIDEQQELIAELHDHLGDRVAAAKVEADAEAVIAASFERETGHVLLPAEEPRPWWSRRPMRIARSAASALASAAAAVALLVVAATPPGPSSSAASAIIDERGTVGDPDQQGLGSRAGESIRHPGQRAAGPNELSVRRLFSSAPSAGTDGDGAGRGDRHVLELRALVANVVATVEEVAAAARDGWERALSERTPDAPAPDVARDGVGPLLDTSVEPDAGPDAEPAVEGEPSPAPSPDPGPDPSQRDPASEPDGRDDAVDGRLGPTVNRLG